MGACVSIYIFNEDEKYLNLRNFEDDDKSLKYAEQQGKCQEDFELEDMEGDHITPWIQGGKTTLDNLQMLCKSCNRRKSHK